MAFRFRRSIKIMPGVRLNIGKKGGSVRVGGKGFGVTKGTSGTHLSAGIPGTGLSYTKKAGRKREEQTGGVNYFLAGMLGLAFLVFILYFVFA